MAKKENWVSKLKEDIGLLLKGEKAVKHSPAGKKHIKKKKKETQPTYFRGAAFRRPVDTGGKVPEVDELLRKKVYKK